jgi:hypothetical protein
MAKLHPFVLLALLFFIVAIGVYFGIYKTESFAASDGGALIQLATSHVPTRAELRRF